MALSMHTIKPARGAVKKRKRVGRGNASGHGTYSTRGLKGQKSRSGVSNLKRLGMKQVLLRTPKKRGFKSLAVKDQVVNLSSLNILFKDGEEINPKTLYAKNLISAGKSAIKLLGDGDLKIKGLIVSDLKISVSAREQLEKMGAAITPFKKK